jgi:hypothetical protein
MNPLARRKMDRSVVGTTMERETLPGVGDSTGRQTGFFLGKATDNLRRARRVSASVPRRNSPAFEVPNAMDPAASNPKLKWPHGCPRGHFSVDWEISCR